MKKQFFKPLMLSATLGLLFTVQSCKKDPPADNEEELITTVHIIATDTTSGSQQVFTFRDIDGEGGNPPTQFDSITLAPSRVYNVSMLLLDESKNPTDTISKEILAEADDHLFVFTPNPSSLVNIAITDKDSRNLPLGLTSRWTTNTTGRGTTGVVLRHQVGVKNGTAAPGESDIELDFITKVSN
jgi:hypothetical protein